MTQQQLAPPGPVALLPSVTDRVTRGLRTDEPIPLLDHILLHGALAPPRERVGAPVPELLELASISGRGGAGFPLARKMQAMGRGRSVVVVNGAEGEPAIWKDRLLLAHAPHLVLDGAALAADAVRATEIHVVVSPSFPAAVEAVRQAIAERAAARYDRLPVKLTLVEDRFVAGEASAVVNRIDRGTSLPTFSQVRTSQRGVNGRPTLLSNAETYAQLAVLVHGGAASFASVGTPDAPGTTLFTVRGAVRRQCVVEMPIGTAVGAVISAAGGAVEPIAAVLTGGYHGRWVAADRVWWQPASPEGLRAVGGSIGAGLVLALPASVCPLAESAAVVGYLADQTAGQCGPCVNGLPAIAGAVAELARGDAGGQVVADLARWCGLVEGRGVCHHPDGTAAFVWSMLETFAEDVALHRIGHCGRPSAGVLPV
jgi:NADH:ubiquinone oxidoreductase subunit F (NADH-binding)